MRPQFSTANVIEQSNASASFICRCESRNVPFSAIHHASEILKSCRQALEEGGQLLIIERILPDRMSDCA
jgi:hypothetical protein